MRMNKEQQRIAIAEWMGWKKDKHWELNHLWCHDNHVLSRKYDELPDYPNDLNAMHEAEKKIRENQFHFVHYPENLFLVVTGLKWNGHMGYFMFNYINATAAQRSEALCRTLWPERFE